MTPSERRSAWIRAARRRNEIIRLGIDRRGSGGKVDARRFAFVAAATLAAAPAGHFQVKGRFCTWTSLDGPALADLLRKAEVAEVGCDDDLIGWALDRVALGVPLTAEAAGALLNLRADERERLAIRSLEAVDETRIARKAREREQRKAKDRDRKHRSRPASKKHNGSLARLEPWKDAGISRATWFRRRNETDLSAKTNAETEMSAETHRDRETDLSVRLKCPGTHVVKGEADKLVSPLQDTAPAIRVWPSKPSTGMVIGGGVAARQGAGGRSIVASSAGQALGINMGLGDGCRSPKSVSAKKEMAQLGRSVPTEDPREIVAQWIPSVLCLSILLDDLGEGDGQLGLRLALKLGRERLRALRSELDAGAPAEVTLAAARAAALSSPYDLREGRS